MSSQAPTTDAELAEQCHWWWRRSFAKSSEQQIADVVNLLNALRESDLSKYLAAVTEGGADAVRPSSTPEAPSAGNPFEHAKETVSAIFEQTCLYSAWLYEVGFRVKGKYEFGRPWIELNLEQKAQLAQRWPDPVVTQTGGYVRIVASQDLTPLPPGWTPPLNLSWNLNLENRSLARGFLEMIERMRQTQGVQNPLANKGKRRRPFGWRDVELMDIQQHRLRSLDEPESSQVSKARAEYKAAMKAGKKEAISKTKSAGPSTRSN